MSEIRLNPNGGINLLLLGQEQLPLFVVDDFLQNPERLVERAARGEDFKADPANFYPGVRNPLPDGYGRQIASFVQTRLLSSLGEPTTVNASQTALAITNQDPLSLLPIQRIPHFDSCDPKQWAMVHYLCDEDFGGTGFFRHISSGFESITADRQRKYQRLLEDDAARVGLPVASYLQGGSSLFEETHRIDAKFNRALFYPSNIFHSGLIRRWQSSQIGQCRLTANCFLQLD